MEDPSTLRKEILEWYEDSKNYEARKAAEFRKNYETREAAKALQQQQQAQYETLQRVKLEALQQALGNYGVYTYLDLNDLIDPNNKNWTELTYRLPSSMVSPTESAERHGHIGFDKPAGLFINNIRNAKTIGDVYKQSELWDSYDPLSSRDNARKYFRYMFGGSQPESPTTNEPNPAQITAGDTAGGVQGVQGAQGAQAGTQGVQAGAKPGNAVAGGGTTSTQGTQTGGTSGGTYASANVPKGGTKTIGYDPNPGTPAPDQPPQYGGPLVRRQKLQEAIENSNDSNPWLGGNYGSRRPGWGLVEENPQAPVKSAGKPRKVRKGNAVVGGGVQGSNSKPGKKPRMSDAEIDAFLNEELGGDTTGNGTYASAGIPRGGVVSPATMMRTSGVQPVQAAYGNNAPMGEGFDYTLTYDPISNSMKPNDPYSYYDPSRNAPSSGDILTYDPMTSQLVRR